MNILERFETIVEKFPLKTAVSDDKEKITFYDLRKEAILLSNSFSNSELKNEAIGVIIDRSILSIVSMMAVLYSGNYYVPIDPKMPSLKKKAIFEETNMKYLLLDDENVDCLHDSGFKGDIISRKSRKGLLSKFNFAEFDSNNPLYMVYTSGSTGKPKGVLKSHKSMDCFMMTYINKYKFNDETVIGNQSPFYFDASAKDLYMMMYAGATMEIIPTPLFTTPYRLIEYLNQKRINFISWVPSMLSMIVQLDTFHDIKPEYLKKVFFVGESFPIKQLNKWLQQLPNIEYVNLFGSSEVAGVFATYEVKEIMDDQKFLPIGKALDNCKVLLIDNDAIVEEAGHLGEIIISSEAVATCYYNDDKKTNEKFVITDKFTGKKERFFITGDIAQYDENHNLVFVTRKDFQIKKMGYRIELGEIEAIANKYQYLKSCCVVYNQEKKKIILYCETNDENIDRKEIKEYLKNSLPDYMMPDKITILDSLPLNANGKIDRVYLKSIS